MTFFKPENFDNDFLWFSNFLSLLIFFWEAENYFTQQSQGHKKILKNWSDDFHFGLKNENVHSKKSTKKYNLK